MKRRIVALLLCLLMLVQLVPVTAVAEDAAVVDADVVQSLEDTTLADDPADDDAADSADPSQIEDDAEEAAPAEDDGEEELPADAEKEDAPPAEDDGEEELPADAEKEDASGLCQICKEEGCAAVHFYCEVCKAYDCGLAHIYCTVCEVMDCGKCHFYCEACKAYDCGVDHDESAPPAAPVIPDNPTLNSASVSIVDEYGKPVTAKGFALVEGEKASLSAWSKLRGNVSYQWQICYSKAYDLWVDIQGETGKGILLSRALFLGISGTPYLRCVTTNGTQTRFSDAIPLTVVGAKPAAKSAAMYAARSLGATKAAEIADAAQYSIIIEFKFRNGDTAAQPWTASLSEGQDYVLDVESPEVVGYKPDQERITETITGITGNRHITVYYDPDYVDFKVIHHQQNITGNDYTAVKTETMTGLTGSPVGTGLEENYAGFYDLVYDPEITVAADSSTVINIYYDRNYYLVALNLNGGYGAEPVYARYGTPLNALAFEPQRTGYAFAGWSPALPASVPIGGTSHIAQWTKADTGFTVAFWYENANDENYTFVGSVQQTAVTGARVNGETYKDVAFAGRDNAHFTFEKADSNVEVKADGSTVVNVYFTRNAYTLTYLRWQCLHTHSRSCCTLTEHTHSHSQCCSSSWLPEWMHAHQYKDCPVGYEHTHGSGCNTVNCGNHNAAYGCPCTNTDAGWYVAYTGTFKYEQDVSAVHAAQGAERWCPKTGSGFANEGIYGGGLAVGTFSSMHGNNVTFYQSSAGTTQYYLTFWLETYDGSGSRNYNGKNFAQGTTFTPKMGAVGYKGDYQAGRPAGFNDYEAWTSNSKGGSNVAQLIAPDGGFSGDTYVYFNFYYTRQTFDLTYFNGSTVVTTRTMKYDEPLTNTYNLQNLSMTSPYGNGYVFAGWYLDPECTVPVSWGSTRMPDGGMAVYAKWAPITHTVNTYLTKGGTHLYSYTAIHGTTVSDPPADPTRGGYSFVSWFYEEDGVQKAYNFSMPVNRDMELYAVWTSDTLATGTITYKERTTGAQVAEPTRISGLVGATKTYAAKIGTELSSGYQTGYFPEIPSHNIEFSATSSQNNYTFYYTKMDEVAYTVRYLDRTTGAALRDPTTGKSNSGKITINHIPIPGYAADAYSKDLVLSSDPSLNIVTFYYTKDDVHAPVQVEHYIQNTSGNGYSHYFSAAPYNGTIGEIQTAAPLNLSGFTYNKSGNSINGVKLTAEGLVLKLYYDRNSYSYEFRFLEKDTNKELHKPVTGSGLYGAQIPQIAPSIPGYELTSAGSLTITIAVDESSNVRTFYYEEDTVSILYRLGAPGIGGSLTRDSEELLAVTGVSEGSEAVEAEYYDFVGWYSDYACTRKISDDPAFKPSKTNGVWVDAVYYAKFVEEQVSIHYQISGPVSSATLSRNSERVSVLTGEALGSSATPAVGYSFEGWYDNEDCTGTPVSRYETFAPSKNGEKWIDGTTYYAKIVEKDATINYVAVGRGSVTPISENVLMLTGDASGAEAIAKENISSFVGWYDNAACEGDPLSTDAEFTPTRPTAGWRETNTYYAKFALQEYTIDYDANGGSEVASLTYDYEDNVTLAASPSRDNYVFKGWKLSETVGTWTAGTYEAKKNVGTGNYGDITLVAQWDPISYTITYDANGGSAVDPQTYDIEDDVTLAAAPDRENYEFKGWLLSEAVNTWAADTYEAEENIGTGKYGDITLVAQWEALTAPYTIEVYKQKVEGDDYELTTYPGSGNIGEEARADSSDYSETGFTYVLGKSTESGEITADGKLVLKLYFDRVPVKVSYSYTGTVPEGAPAVPKEATYRYGATVTVADAPTLDGYTFSGWSKSGTITVTEDTTVTGSWTANTDAWYLVHYYLENTTESLLADKKVEGKTFGESYTETAPAIPGFKLAGEEQQSVTAGYEENEITFYYEPVETNVTIFMHVEGKYANLKLPFTGTLNWDHHEGSPQTTDSAAYSLKNGESTDSIIIQAGSTFHLSDMMLPDNYAFVKAEYKNVTDTDMNNGAVENDGFVLTEGDCELHIYYKAIDVTETGLYLGNAGAIAAILAVCAALIVIYVIGRRRRRNED